MVEATVCFMLLGSPPRKVLLGLKKKGFGAGKYNGFGGKVGRSETPVRATIREIREECGLIVSPDGLCPMGSIDFFFPDHRAYDHHVHVFTATSWDGEPQETAEMAPAWFAIEALPYDKMWADDAHWLPLVLAGVRIDAEFTFEADNETIATFAIQQF
jgi:8-oxo-dGTP diphosphatase